MFFLYCSPQKFKRYTLKIELLTAISCYQYCKLYHFTFEEIVITDEMDFCVMHLVKSILKIPFPENEFKYFDLLKNTEVSKEEWGNDR